MAKQPHGDDFAEFDPLLAAQPAKSPWVSGTFLPDIDLFRDLLSIPISQGDKQASGRPAKALDAWIAQELRRAGFDGDAVWPRNRRPRVLAEGLAGAESKLEELARALVSHEAASQERLKPPSLRRAIREATDALPGNHEAYILGDFYAKQIDVGSSSWRRGPDLLISTKSMFGSYRKNLKNRHEEAVGEVSSLRRRHPMAAMGYVYLVRHNIFEEEGAYPILVDILTRLRRPSEAFDATMLLMAKWDDQLPNPVIQEVEQPAEHLSASRFFMDLIAAVTERTPFPEHRTVRVKRDGEPVGGMPNADEDDIDPDDV